MNVLNVCVTGATGYIGGRLVPQLLEGGHRVTCLARDASRLVGRWPAARIVEGDLFDPEALRSALAGADVAYYLIHSMHAGEAVFRERDRTAARVFAAAAAEAGVRHIVYLGGLGNGDLSPHLASRQETGALLGESGIPVTELRAAVVVGAGSASFELMRYLVDRLPVMLCPRWVRTRCQPIAVDDVLRYLVAAATTPAAQGRTLDIGGADVLTYADMMLGYAAARGLSRRIIDVPVMTPRLSSWWCDLVTPIPASIARPLVDGLATEAVVRDDAALEIFAFRPLGYEEALRRALDRGAETAWSDSLASMRRPPVPIALELREGLIRERRRALIAADRETVFTVLSGIGGRRGWLYADRLWRLRAAVDRLLGGVGRRRGRRDPDHLRPGDAVDFWRVERCEPPARLLLRAEMRLPGRAWLAWTLTPAGRGCTELVQDALFEPRGLAGLAYWYALYPAHRLIFGGLVRQLAVHAERRADAAGTTRAA